MAGYYDLMMNGQIQLPPGVTQQQLKQMQEQAQMQLLQQQIQQHAQGQQRYDQAYQDVLRQRGANPRASSTLYYTPDSPEFAAANMSGYRPPNSRFGTRYS